MKTLKQIIEATKDKPEPTAPIEPDSITAYVPKTKDEKRFMDKHVVKKTDDVNGNKDDVFRATNIKAYDRAASRHGYNAKQDQEVYEETQDDLQEKTLTAAEKKKREQIAKAIQRENPRMDKSKKMAIATATAKRVAEGWGNVEANQWGNHVIVKVPHTFASTRHNKDHEYELHHLPKGHQDWHGDNEHYKLTRDQKPIHTSNSYPDVLDHLRAIHNKEAVKEEAQPSKGNAFDWKNTPSQTKKKPGEATGHESKKTEKGTMYTKKTVKEDTDPFDVWGENADLVRGIYGDLDEDNQAIFMAMIEQEMFEELDEIINEIGSV